MNQFPSYKRFLMPLAATVGMLTAVNALAAGLINPDAAPHLPHSPDRGQVSVTLQPDQSEIMPGNSVRYTLTVKNLSRRTQHNLTASFQFDPQYMQIIEVLPSQASLQGNVASWEIDKIYAGQEWTLRFPVYVKDHLAAGMQVAASARVSGEEVDPASSTQLSTTVTIGTPILPPTGARLDALFLLVSAVATFILTSTTRRRLLFVSTA